MVCDVFVHDVGHTLVGRVMNELRTLKIYVRDPVILGVGNLYDYNPGLWLVNIAAAHGSAAYREEGKLNYLSRTSEQ